MSGESSTNGSGPQVGDEAGLSSSISSSSSSSNSSLGGGSESVPDPESDLEGYLEAIRPPEKSESELNELAPVTSSVQPIEVRESAESAGSAGSTARSGSSVEVDSSDAEERSRTKAGSLDGEGVGPDVEVNPAVAELNELAPVSDVPRPASEEVCGSRSSSPVDEECGSDSGEQDRRRVGSGLVVKVWSWGGRVAQWLWSRVSSRRDGSLGGDGQ